MINGNMRAFLTIRTALSVTAGAVVGTENQHRVIGDSQFLQLVAVEPNLIVEVVHVVVDPRIRDGTVSVVHAFVARDMGVGSRVSLTVPFDDRSSRPLGCGIRIQPVECVVAEVRRVVDKKRFAIRLLTIDENQK